MNNPTTKIQVIDSHTGGEPTRVVIAGGPNLGSGTLQEQLRLFREQHDDFRSAVVNEPRGSDVVVGALLLEPRDTRHTAGVIFFNNVGTLGMCGHGTIGLMETLRHLGRIKPGRHVIATPVGDVTAEIDALNFASVQNVASYRHRKNVGIHVDGIGPVTGDVAWGGNWFFLVTSEHGQTLELQNVEELTRLAWNIRQCLRQQGITGDDGAEIDHVELYGPARGDADSRNFVLCPGKAYDRSPCGTGTSAKLACLFADGKLKPGEIWRQESIVGSVFEGSVEIIEGKIFPTIKGRAFITGESTLVLQDQDPFKYGIR